MLYVSPISDYKMSFLYIFRLFYFGEYKRVFHAGKYIFTVGLSPFG